jgi:hypothetical protein
MPNQLAHTFALLPFSLLAVESGSTYRPLANPGQAAVISVEIHGDVLEASFIG